MNPPPPFAYRFWQIKPNDVSASGDWPEHSISDPVKPPNRWKRDGFVREWYAWRSPYNAKPLHDSQVTPRTAYSVLWCQVTQRIRVVIGDCADITRKDRPEEWYSLGCTHLENDARPRTGLWRLADAGGQHDSVCPLNFEEFLPKNFFRGNNNQPCHFVGPFSLMLALLALCPENPDDIPRQIDEGFYCGNLPRYIPCSEHRYWGAMNKYKPPGRALVMQTGLINTDPDSTNEDLRTWEDGFRGSMVSSHDPTLFELRQWGLL